MWNSYPLADCLGQPPTNSKHGPNSSTADGCILSTLTHYATIIVMSQNFFRSSCIAFTCSCHNADIECLSIGHSCVPKNKCTDFPLTLDGVSAIFHCLLLLLCLFLTDGCFSKGT